MAKIALAAAGAVIGAFFLGPPGIGLGFSAGMMLGQVLMPTKLPNQVGPRLGDLSVSSGANGAPIPIGYGVFRLAGQMIWSPGLVEHAKTTKQSAKGGPSYKSTSYTYTASFAAAFGESYGATPGARTGDITKIWFDTKVVLDSTATGTIAYPAPTIYHGTEAQNPDPLIQADKGVNNTPAFRGIIYAVWEDFPLGDFGNRIPNVQALVSYGSTQPMNLSDVFTDICTRAGLTTSQIDVSQVTPSSGSSVGSQLGIGGLCGAFTDSSGNVILPISIGYGGTFFVPVGATQLQLGIDDDIFNDNAGSFNVTASVAGGASATVTVGGQAQPWLFTGGINTAFNYGLLANTGTAPVVPSLGTLTAGQAITITANSGTVRFRVGPTVFVDAAGFSVPGGVLAVSGDSLGFSGGFFPTHYMHINQFSATVTGYILSSQVDSKTALQNLLAANFIDCVESDFKLKFVPRGTTTPALTAPENDLGTVQDGAELIEQTTQEQDMPREVSVMFIDPSINWQQNKTHKQRHRRGIHTKQLVTFQLPMVLTPTQARSIAEKQLYLAYLNNRPYTINLWKATYMALDPTDILAFVYKGATYQVRLTTHAIGVDFTSQTSAVSEASTASATSNPSNPYNGTPTGGISQGVPATTAPVTIPTALYLFDVPYLQDGDAVSDRSSTGFYYAMGATDPAWPGGLLETSSDGTTYSVLASDTNRVSYGQVTGTLGDAPNLWTWDMTNTLTVVMTNGTLSGSTDLAVLNGANVLIVGKEVIQYVNATQTSPGTFLLSRLLRGRRNTEYAAVGHSPSEAVVDPTTGAARQGGEPLSLIGLLRHYKGVTVGQDITTVSPQDLTLLANDLKPASPVHVSGTIDSGNNITITWVRRTRYAGDWLNNTGDVPLNESSEAYDVEIISGGGTVLRTFSGVAAPAVIYTSAQQVADFGSNQTSLRVKVYQISKEVGRGNVADTANIFAGLPQTGGTSVNSTTGSVQKYATTIGDGSTLSYTVAHALGTTDVTVQVFELTGSLREAVPEIQIVNVNQVKIIFAVAPALNSYRVVVEG